MKTRNPKTCQETNIERCECGCSSSMYSGGACPREAELHEGLPTWELPSDPGDPNTD